VVAPPIGRVRAGELPGPLSGRAARASRGEDKKGLATTHRAIAEPPKVINLMEASKRNVARGAEPEPKKAAVSKPTRAKAVPDRRQRALLLPVPGGREKKNALVAEPAASTAPKRRKKAG